MKLITNCYDCKEQIKISAFMIDNRIELAKKKGTEFELRCDNCGHLNNFHVDDVKAIDGLYVKIIGLLSIIVAIILTAAFWRFGYIAMASVSIPILITTTVNKNQRTKINQFNLMYYDSNRLRR